MRTCSRCKLLKEDSDFYGRSDRQGKPQSQCKTCNGETRVELTKRNKRTAIEHFGGGCSSCGYDKCDAALHFHHPDPSLKEDMFHRLRNRSTAKIIAALTKQKCILLCANCHAEAHHH